MNPGRLDRLITLIKPITSSDGAGGTVTHYVGAGTDWASMRPITVRDLIAGAGQTIPTIDTVWRLRFRTDIASGWRIRHDGRDHELQGPPIEIDRRAFLDCATRTVGAATITPPQPAD